MKGDQFIRSFIIKVDYLFYFIKFFNRDTYFTFSILTIIDRCFILLQSWIILVTSCTLYGIFRMSSLFLHSRKRTFKSYYNTIIKRKCPKMSNLKLLLLYFLLFQLLNKNNIHKSGFENLILWS